MLDQVLNEFSSFQNDVQCLKMILNSSPKLMKLAAEKGKLLTWYKVKLRQSKWNGDLVHYQEGIKDF